ncbi:ABC transporter ATP-binding protein [Tessaracoccus flavus]|uniref:Iron ABC transporter ATP-binding protein n=1 Tax=Tessaracoccus flavus TaxID=1610493 RepID=A0A1Q2CI79_9ACTN|nr:ABC transporter ATP-binding protein [Tessaracoccus flavus]AQP45804.1 iron ABC transporter ATP-binding protein [Tessaracoccus flavus]SDZ14365.1 ATP-binding cassette, subfamily B [Tessaracoccus flavus]
MRSIIKIMATAKQLWPLYLGIVIGAIAIAVTSLMTPFVIARATDTVVGIVEGRGGAVSTLIWLAVALLVINLANSAISNLTGFWGDLMATRLRVILSQRYFHKLLRLPQRYYDNELTGTLISRLNRSITSITDFLQMFSNSFFPMLITVFAVLGISLFYSPWLALLLILIYPTFVWLTTLTSKRWQVWEHQKNEHYDIAGGRFAEVIGQMRVVKSFVTERRELDKFSGHYDAAVGLTREQSAFWHRMDLARRGVLDVVFFAIYAIIFVQTAQGQYSLGVMVMLIQLVTMARQPVTSMSYLVDTTQRAIAGSHEYFKVMNEIDEPNNPLEAQPSATVEWTDEDPVVAFRDVNFGYGDDDGDLVLKDIDLEINRGERVAFVGESGGGKTTLVNLIMKLYPATSGEIRVYGQSVRDVPTEELRREIGVVFQDASLFSGTIRENMAYGIADVTDEQLETAARRANALGFINGLKDRFDTEIGERGVKLSGGQKQRLSVARALLKDAPVLILDEATSSLDTKSERAVQAGLEELMEGRTTLIIAHRLSTISTVDRIVTLREGRIDEIGTPAELATTGGIYAELLALQGSTRKADKARLLAYDITS